MLNTFGRYRSWAIIAVFSIAFAAGAHGQANNPFPPAPTPYPSWDNDLVLLAAAQELKDAFTESAPALTAAELEGKTERTLTFNKSAYDRGEPVIATLTIKNVGGAPIALETGGDYRAGREERIAFAVTNEKGEPVRDPLKIFLQSGMAGGLGGSALLQPGESRSRSVLLNQYADLRFPGTYTCEAMYDHDDSSTDDKLPFGPVKFEVGKRNSRTSEEAAWKLFEERDLAIHPCILYGLRDETAKIPELLEMACAERPNADQAKLEKARYFAESNRRVYAAEALVMMSDKKALYDQLAEAIVESKDNNGALRMIFQSALAPDESTALEPYFNDPNPDVSALAFTTALALGNGKAIERLPSALAARGEIPEEQSAAKEVRSGAFHSACLYLYRLENPSLHISGISAAGAAKAREALLEGFEHEMDRDLIRSAFHSFCDFPDLWRQALSQVMREGGPERRGAVVAALSSALLFHDAEKEALFREALPLIRDAAENHPDMDVRSRALILLGRLQDRESAPMVEKQLESGQEDIRIAAAVALILLRDERRIAECIEILAQAPPNTSGGELIGLAYWMGMENAGKAFSAGMDRVSAGPYGYSMSSDSLPPDFLKALRRIILRVLYDRYSGAPPTIQLPEVKNEPRVLDVGIVAK